MVDVLMVIAPDGFRDEEYFLVREELENAGHKVSVACEVDVAKSSVEHKEVVADVLIEEADVADYDAIVFSGGPGANVYFENDKVLEMCYQTIEQGKILAAICVAPGILARAGVLSGKKATSFESEIPSLDEAGAITSDGHVVVDGQIITADGPEVSSDFGKKIVEVLKNQGETEKEEKNDDDDDDERVDIVDDGFPENKPYYDDKDVTHEKRVVESDESI